MNVPAQQQQGAMQLPAHLQGYTSRSLSKTVAANIGTAAPPYISIQANKFTLVDSAGNELPAGQYDPALGVYLDCTIFDVNDYLSKVYYSKLFDPGAASFTPPDCWSDNGTGPSRQASIPQSNICATCPRAEWGSATSRVTGKGVKACSDQQKVAVYVPGQQIFFLLRIPPNSLKNFRAYSERFNGQPFDMDAMVTRISFEPQGVGTLLFQAVNWIDQQAAAVISDARTKNATDALVGRTDVARDPNSLPAPNAPAQDPNAYAGVAMPPPAQGFPPQATQAAPAGGFQGQPYPGVAPGGPLGAQTVAAPTATPSPAPQGQPAGFPTQPATQPAASPATAPSASPSEAPRPGRGRRRTAATAQPAPAAAAPAQAPFPHPGQAAPAGAPAGFPPPAPAPTGAFGMQPGSPVADPALSAALATTFGTPR